VAKKIQILKTGKFRGTNGKEFDITDEILSELEQTYNPAVGDAKLVIGHPEFSDPAMGDIIRLEKVGNLLFAEIDRIKPEMIKKNREGYYDHVSASLYTPDTANNPEPGKWYLRHVGMLGAVQPAVKGLEAVQFADHEDGTVSIETPLELADFEGLDPVQNRLNSVGILLGRCRDYLIEKEGQERADNILPVWEIDYIKREFIPVREPASFAESEEIASLPSVARNDDSEENKEEDTDMTDAEKIAKLEADIAAKDKENAGLKAEIAKSESDALLGKVASFADAEMIGKGRLLPAKKDEWVKRVLRFIELEKSGTADFAERDIDGILAGFAEMVPENSVAAVDGKEKFTKGTARGSADFADEDECVSALDHPEEGGK
jgi:hypothetical protein